MRNLELAQIFYLIADLLDMKEVSFKPRAYAKVARVLESLEKDVGQIYQEGGLEALENIPGVGKNIALKIEEFIKTGKLKSYQKLKKECPVDLDSLMAIEGLGSKKIKVLYQKLKIKNLKDLEKAAKLGKIRELAGFGQKSEQAILQGIAFVKAGQGRFLLGLTLPLVKEIIGNLEKLTEVEKIKVAGSIRRMKETVGDIDILVISDQPEKVMDYFVGMPEVIKVWAKGPTKSSVRFKQGLDCDLRVIKKESFGAALQYFTGSKDHNILTRRLARKKGLKLNEYGVFSAKGGERIAGQTEEEVYQAIGLPYIEPELRTNSGEIEAALQQAQGKPNGLPELIGYHDIKGDCHCHSDWSDGLETIAQMAQAAKKMGYQYIVITDHTKDLRVTNGLDEKKLLSQMKEIDKINSRLKDFRILKGCEANIRADGRIDIKDEVLSKMDLVVAAVHSQYKMSEKEMTQRIIRAMENPQVDIIGHPTGRRIFKREAYQLNLDQIFKAAKRTKTALEINAQPERLDLRDVDIRRAREAGVKLVISSDAHSISQLTMMELGIAQARRGWAAKKDILNTKDAP